MKKIYTLSYTQHTPEALLALAEERDAVIIDVRLSPRSRKPQYAGKNLGIVLGSRYIHVRGFGNVNYKNGGPIEFSDLAGGEAIVRPILAKQSILLTCVCKDVNICHRKNIAEYLSRVTGLKVEHLGMPAQGTPKAPSRASVTQMMLLFL